MLALVGVEPFSSCLIISPPSFIHTLPRRANILSPLFLFSPVRLWLFSCCGDLFFIPPSDHQNHIVPSTQAPPPPFFCPSAPKTWGSGTPLVWSLSMREGFLFFGVVSPRLVTHRCLPCRHSGLRLGALVAVPPNTASFFGLFIYFSLPVPLTFFPRRWVFLGFPKAMYLLYLFGFFIPLPCFAFPVRNHPTTAVLL